MSFIKTHTLPFYSFTWFKLFKTFPKLTFFRPKYDFVIETDKYLVKTASKFTELIVLFKLRFDCFLSDTKSGRLLSICLDFDKFDFIGDHILIINKENKKVIGTYRVNCSLYSNRFYSQGEFKLDHFLASPGVKLECGRACVHKDYRNGVTMDLLWRGLSQYAILTGARYIFGCSSVHSTEVKSAWEVKKFIDDKEYSSEDFSISPTKEYEMPFRVEVQEVDPRAVKSIFPSLLRAYLSAGAKIYGDPALDKEFECADFITILDLNKLTPSFRRRYFPMLKGA